METAMWHSKSRSPPLYPYIFTCILIAKNQLVQDPWSLLHYQPWAIAGTLPDYLLLPCAMEIL